MAADAIPDRTRTGAHHIRRRAREGLDPVLACTPDCGLHIAVARTDMAAAHLDIGAIVRPQEFQPEEAQHEATVPVAVAQPIGRAGGTASQQPARAQAARSQPFADGGLHHLGRAHIQHAARSTTVFIRQPAGTAWITVVAGGTTAGIQLVAERKIDASARILRVEWADTQGGQQRHRQGSILERDHRVSPPSLVQARA